MMRRRVRRMRGSRTDMGSTVRCDAGNQCAPGRPPPRSQRRRKCRDAGHDESVSDQNGPARPDPALYPDIAPAGDLRSALQAEFDATGLAPQAQHVASPGWRYVAAEVRNAERNADVCMGIHERVFCLQFWARGVLMADGTTGELPAVAAAMHAWQSGVRVRQLVSAWPFLSTNEFAEAYERGDAEAIENVWQQYHHNTPPARQLTRLHPFIALAFDQPRLRALLPYTSH